MGLKRFWTAINDPHTYDNQNVLSIYMESSSLCSLCLVNAEDLILIIFQALSSQDLIPLIPAGDEVERRSLFQIDFPAGVCMYVGR